MGISEKKMQIVINNYFKQECDVNTSIREAFEKGFRIGVKKGQSAQPDHNADVSKKVADEDCISRRAAIDALDKRFDSIPMEQTTEILQLRRDLRERIPSTKPKIIYCKDCIWYELPSHRITENCVRWMKSNGILLPIKPNDYCSYAERRTDGQCKSD